MLRADNFYANAALAELASKRQSAVFAKEHRVFLFFNENTGQPYSSTRWSGDNMSPNITAKFVNPRIVENIPEAVTIATTNEVNGSTCFFIYTYKHNGHVCDLSPQELEKFETNGYWPEYVARNGDPVAKKRESWIQQEEETWQRWKQAIEADFFAHD